MGDEREFKIKITTAADATVPLQPGEYVTVTYSVGTPVMTWKPF